jgi:hypothetical protein
MLTYFDLFANYPVLSQRHRGLSSEAVRQGPWRVQQAFHGANRCADAAGALSWAAESYRVLARDAKAYNST